MSTLPAYKGAPQAATASAVALARMPIVSITDPDKEIHCQSKHPVG
jgi:hypothetical protein